MSSVCRTSLPTRIGGFDQIRSNVVSAGMPSAVAAWMLPMPLSSALRRVSSSARSLTSNAQMSAFGEAKPNANAIGPQPQPRSRNVPSSGGSGA